MLKKAEVLEQIHKTGLVPVLRAENEYEALKAAEAMFAGGLNILELTLTVPGAVHLFAKIHREHPDILLGAGTVLDPETARICILEGAHFIVSPALNLKTIELCQRYSTVAIPGALTPTEIITAWQAGADVIKIFPASAMGGASYLKSLKGPLPQIELIPTGGVDVHTARAFLEAGAYALGVGTDLVDMQAIRAGQAHLLTERSMHYLAIVRDFRDSK